MPENDPKVDAFYAKDGPWHDALAALRAILKDCPVTEEFKWRNPTYTAHGGNIVQVWALKENPALGFLKGVLLADRDGLLEAPGENSHSMRVMKFTGAGDVTARAATVRAYVTEAVENEKAGRKVDFPKEEMPYPEELIDRLEADEALRTAFEALTPGRRRGYLLHFSDAKQSATRTARIEKSAPRILEGKGMHDR